MCVQAAGKEPLRTFTGVLEGQDAHIDGENLVGGASAPQRSTAATSEDGQGQARRPGGAENSSILKGQGIEPFPWDRSHEGTASLMSG